jgi:protein involved in polysaccharide export with SLBB domain
LVSTAFIIGALIAPVRVIAQNNAAQNNAQSNPDPAPAASAAPPDAANHPGDANVDRPALQQRYPRYQVTRSDVLSLSFPLSPELNRQVTVQPDGYINLQSTRSVYVQGMTVPEIVVALKKAYANVLRDPIIDVDLVDFQRPFFIAGIANTNCARHHRVPGYCHGAGGSLPAARPRYFSYHQRSWLNGSQETKPERHLYGKNVNMQPGDDFVPEKAITIFGNTPLFGGTAFNPQPLRTGSYPL